MDGNRINNYRPAGTDVVSAKKRAAKKKAKNKLYAFLIVLILIFLTFWLLFDKVFVIKSFRISGETVYTEEQAAALAGRIGLNSGIHMFGFDKAEKEKLAKYALSEFDSVEIAYDIPNTIIFKVKESVPAMYIDQGDYSFVLSEGLRVMSMTEKGANPEADGIIHVIIDGVSSCIAGEFLETENSSDEILKELYSVLKEEGALADAGEIDLSNRFQISFQYKDRFTVLLGDAENLTVKVRFMMSIEEMLKDSDQGYIDVSDENFREGIFKAYS